MDPVLAGTCVGVGAILGGLVGARWGRARTSTAVEAPTGADPLECVAENLPAAIVLFAEGGGIRVANRAAETLLFAGQPLVGQNLIQLIANAPQAISQALTGVSDELFTLDEDGAPQTFLLLRREVLLDDAPHTLMLLNPVTREVARRELSVLKNVIRVISHELNNSLASMSSLLNSGRHIAANPDKLPKLGRVLDGLEERTQHLQRFLGEYATLSRLPATQPRRIAWAPMLSRLRLMYPHATIETPDDDTGWIDEAQVEQALINLLKNAQESGGAAEEVRVVFRLDGAKLEIGVLDRGTGFSSEALQQGLLPFYSTKENGSGVGLALCREVAEGHVGSLRIKNRDGGGSAVYLSLPASGQERAARTSVALSLTST